MAPISTPLFSQHEEGLALQALQDSEKLLQQIDIASVHIQRVYRVQIIASSPPSGPYPENTLALELILARLKSLKTTIELNQFFPRAYFSSRLSLDMTFDPENAETYALLRAFTKKYSFGGEESWGQHAAFEVDTFQTYDAPDFKEYLGLKFGHLAPQAEEESCVSATETDARSSEKRSSSETAPTSTEISAPAPDCAKVKNGGGGGGCANGNRKLAVNVDQGSVRSGKSSKVKGKLKGVFGFGFKKKRMGSGFCSSDRTKALLGKPNSVVSGNR